MVKKLKHAKKKRATVMHHKHKHRLHRFHKPLHEQEAYKIHEAVKKPGFFDGIAKFFPDLQKKLIIANILTTPSFFLKNAVIHGIINAVILTTLSFLLLQKAGSPLILLALLFLIFFFIFFYFNLMKINVIIARKKKAIDNEVVYAGRYMLLKLHSGRPLLNALIDQSQSYGVAANYVKGIVNDVNSGSTIEQSLNKAMLYTPSDKFRKILFYINNALKYGVDVSGPLEWAINEIVEEDMIDIRKYGKKMNSLMIFYMLLAVVLPSLGITIFIVITGFLNISVGLQTLLILNFFILAVQLLFLGVVKSVRPTIDL